VIDEIVPVPKALIVVKANTTIDPSSSQKATILKTSEATTQSWWFLRFTLIGIITEPKAHRSKWQRNKTMEAYDEVEDRDGG